MKYLQKSGSYSQLFVFASKANIDANQIVSEIRMFSLCVIDYEQDSQMT